jgi:hypothetical protein
MSIVGMPLAPELGELLIVHFRCFMLNAMADPMNNALMILSICQPANVVYWQEALISPFLDHSRVNYPCLDGQVLFVPKFLSIQSASFLRITKSMCIEFDEDRFIRMAKEKYF